jgi:hypothetical protein
MKLGIQGTGLTGLGLSEVKSQSDIQKHYKKQFIFNLSERISYPRCTQVKDSHYYNKVEARPIGLL